MERRVVEWENGEAELGVAGGVDGESVVEALSGVTARGEALDHGKLQINKGLG